MPVSFCVLGSGSAGNAAVFLAPRAHVLIDAGFTPGELARRMAGTGASWGTLKAALLTHTHGDHIKRTCLREFAARGIHFYCHAAHVKQLAGARGLPQLSAAGLLHTYEAHQLLELPGGLHCHPLPVPHDRPPTFGFRLEATDSTGRLRTLAYLADLGEWAQDLEALVQGVDLLALEFNHDEHLERTSGRPAFLVERVLGSHGHLSNRQAASALASVLRAAGVHHPRQLVLLHLSQECNREDLACAAARETTRRAGVELEVIATHQHQRGRVHVLGT